MRASYHCSVTMIHLLLRGGAVCITPSGSPKGPCRACRYIVFTLRFLGFRVRLWPTEVPCNYFRAQVYTLKPHGVLWTWGPKKVPCNYLRAQYILLSPWALWEANPFFAKFRDCQLPSSRPGSVCCSVFGLRDVAF